MLSELGSSGKHPVQTGQYELQTPAIKELRIVLGNWLDGGIPGGMVIAPSRFGKSWAIRYFKRKKLPNSKVPVLSIRIPRETQLTMNQFYELLLLEFGHADYTSGTALNKKKRLEEYLQMLGAKSKEYSLYLLIDDAHSLSEQQFSWLCNLYDTLLEEKHTQPCFVLFAEPSLLGRRDALRTRNRTQIIARLMTTDYTFRSIETSAQLKDCLACFDERSEYPPGSGLSFSKFYYQEAFDLGWRLQSEADNLFLAFERTHKEANVAWPFVIPMQYIIASVKYALLSGPTSAQIIPGFTYAFWETAVGFSGFINAGSYLQPPKRRNKSG